MIRKNSAECCVKAGNYFFAICNRLRIFQVLVHFLNDICLREIVLHFILLSWICYMIICLKHCVWSIAWVVWKYDSINPQVFTMNTSMNTSLWTHHYEHILVLFLFILKNGFGKIIHMKANLIGLRELVFLHSNSTNLTNNPLRRPRQCTFFNIVWPLNRMYFCWSYNKIIY